MATDSPRWAAAYEKFRKGGLDALSKEERLGLPGTVDFFFRVEFERGDKRALLKLVARCGERELPLPQWATAVVGDASYRSEKGQLKSWDEVFGKPYPGKSRKGTATESRAVEVWIEVRRLSGEGHPIDEALFERVGKKLKVGRRSTVSRLYWRADRHLRSARSPRAHLERD